MADDHEPWEETPDVYGRSEGCFVDYTKSPYRFEDVARTLESTCAGTSRKDSCGLIDEPGLTIGSFPDVSIGLDEDLGIVEHPDLFELTNVVKAEYTVSPFFSRTAFVRDFQLPLELPELRSDPAKDLEEYRQTVDKIRFDDPFHQWLPISPTRDEDGEGLRFPPTADRLHSLLLRELDCERFEVSVDAAALEEEIYAPISTEVPVMPNERIGRRVSCYYPTEYPHD